LAAVSGESLDERMAEWGREQARQDGVPDDQVELYSQRLQGTMLGAATRAVMARDDAIAGIARPLRGLVRRIWFRGPDPVELLHEKQEDQLRRQGWIP
jgi:hypothetical protein